MAQGLKLLDAYVEVTADGKPAVQQVVDDVENDGGAADKAGRSFGKRLVGGIIGSAALIKVGQFIGGAINDASDLNESLSASQQIFGDQAKAMEDWANTAATSLGISKQAALEASTGFGDMFLQLGFTGDAARENSQSVVQMAADLGSFRNLPTEDVLVKISAAMRGEYDSLRSLIPNISAARVEQEALALSGKKTAAELTAQEKAQAVLNIVSSDGAAAMGDFARTSDGLANQMKIAQAQTADMQAELGGALLPVVGEIAGVLTSQLLPILKDFATWIKQNADWVAPLVLILGALVAVLWLVNIAMMANPIMLIVAAVALLIAGIVLLIMNWDQVVAFLTGLWQGFVDWIVGVMEGFAGWWNDLWAGFADWVTSVWDGFIGWIRDLFLGYVNWLRSIGQAISDWWNGLWDGITSWARDLWQGYVDWVLGIFRGFLGFMRDVGKNLSAWWDGLWSGLGSFVQDAFKNVGNFVIGILNQVIGIVNGAISGLNNMGKLASDLTGGVVSWKIGMLPKIPMLAKGGNLLDDGAAIVGENGPELLTRAAGATVTPLTSAQRNAITSGDAPPAGEQTVIHIAELHLDAATFADVETAIETLRELGKTARQGRGTDLTMARAA